VVKWYSVCLASSRPEFRGKKKGKEGKLNLGQKARGGDIKGYKVCLSKRLICVFTPQ
jgi:hypothetical protein